MNKTNRSLNTHPLVLAVLLAVTFVLGILVSSLLSPSRLSPASSPLPAPATQIPPSPTPPPTPTPTAPDLGDVLPTLYLDIDPDDMAQIRAKRQEALTMGILLSTDEDFVPATIRLEDEEIPVDLRLKGDWMDHYAYDKWSFRVETEGGYDVLGMRTFSLQDPGRRSYIDEWLFLENLRMEGVLGVRYHFAHVVLNGDYMGIYAIEEMFTKELFEAQQRREGVIIRYAEDLLWEYRAFYDDQVIPRGVDYFYLIDEFESGRVDEDPVLAAQRDIAVGLLRGLWTGDLTASEVFDMEKMARFLALSDLWQAEHGLIWHNLRYYYNPVTARLEPIGFDAHPLPSYLDPSIVGLEQSAFYNDPQLQAATARELARMSQLGYVDALEAALDPQFEALRVVMEQEFDSEVLAPPWDALRRRQELIRQALDPYQTAYAYVPTLPGSPTDTVTIDVGNLWEHPLEVTGLTIADRFIPARTGWVDPESEGGVVPVPDDPQALVLAPLPPDATHLPYVRLHVPGEMLPLTDTVDLPPLGIVTRLWGLTATHTDTVILGYPLPLTNSPRPDSPTVEEALTRHPYLSRIEGEEMLEIVAGVWDIEGDLVLPEGFGLRLAPGTTLRFGVGNALFASGPLDFQGTAEAPVTLQPQSDGRWQGVIVLQAGAPSRWRHVTVEGTEALDRDGWTLTGAITFYESPIRLDRCRIVDSVAEDAINVIQSEFAFIQSEFADAASDAFDGDFARGSVEGCSFHDVGGDGIDVSGSDVTVTGTRLVNVGDKAISVGESSRLTAEGVSIENVGFGLASKDLSHVVLTDATIANPRIAALAAYIKKPVYGPASIEASGITFVDTPDERRTLVQTGSWIDLEGTRIWGVDIDVDALYDGQ